MRQDPLRYPGEFASTDSLLVSLLRLQELGVQLLTGLSRAEGAAALLQACSA